MEAKSKALSALLHRTAIDDHEEILKACSTALKTSKGDLEILYTRVIALLKLERHDDALAAIEEGGYQLKEKTKVERAYALYKTGQLEEAKKLAKSIGDNRGARHVEAQASYRSEDFNSASAVYRALSEDKQSEENDLRINSSATDANLEWSNQGDLVEKKKHSREDLELFETAYNAACASIARGELQQGGVLLKRAHDTTDLCMSNEDLTDDEKEAEVLAIRVQQLFVLSSLGKGEEARSLASNISTERLSDASTVKVAQNNAIAARIDQSNPHLNRRLLDAKANLPATDKLFKYQEGVLQQNSLSLDLQAQKPQSVIKTTETILNKAQPSTSPYINALSVLNASAHAQGELANFGLKKILPLFEKRPVDLGLAMTIIQLYVLTNNHGSAINIMDKLINHLSKSAKPSDQDVLHAPGLIALQVSLYSSQNRRSQIRTTLARAASYWRRKSKAPTSLLQAAGTTLLDSPEPEHQAIAREIFSILHQSDPASRLATAGFIASHAQASPSSITETDLSALPPLSEQIQGIDIDALEKAGVLALPNVPSTTISSTRKRQLEDLQKPKKKRIRFSKRPKDFDPDKKMDPERWLPLQDRSSYRPSRKKGKRKEGERERTQGGVAGGDKMMEKGGEVVKGAEKVGGGGGKGKGKKKGKR
ncbi:uncharacterized protein KY384_003116 [Bacidia gigantensis]|uniref:uncharacterized protein n=1 Tax=Bacidia gigantensis TaxID=2732470 RepID=UPI001D03F051|nr:uncharacterized protein KY384_003116 [Bacidia gigantensis]KAG8531487.1 hypothetical protein KY384_003116 [Bacidia gigantensis]